MTDEAVQKYIKEQAEESRKEDSKESYFIQICDFVSSVMLTLKNNAKFNLKASSEKYGLVIYPTK